MKSLEDRQKARELADRLQAEKLANGSKFTDWFEELYAAAGGDSTLVPWANEIPNPGLVEWMLDRPAGHRADAIDIGCGLGDNAAFLNDMGWKVTAIDLSPSAVDWAKGRFSDRGIDFRVGNLLELPEELHGRFKFISEIYTLQSMPHDVRSKAIESVAKLAAENATLLVITRSRPGDKPPEGPPWPLAASELDRFKQLGFEQVSLEQYDQRRSDGRIIPHIRAEYRKHAEG